MNEIYTILIELARGMSPNAWQRSVEIPADMSLYDLHQCIQNVVGFDNDHLYEFYVAKKVRSKKLLPYLKPEIREEPLDTLLNQIFPLPAGHFLFYMFDYGDDWRFKIRKTNRKQQFAAGGEEYPRVVGGEGENPKQYPMWDDDEDWEVEE